MTSTSLSRFQILSYNQLQYPHKCGTCGSFSGDNSRRYVDFGCWVEFYGTVYICTDCFLGATSELNVVPESKFKAVQQSNIELQTVVQTLISENRALRDGIDHIRDSVVSRPHTDSDDNHVVSNSDTERGSIKEGLKQEDSSSSTIRDDRTTTVREEEPVRSNDGRGHSDLRNDDQPIGLDIFNL